MAIDDAGLQPSDIEGAACWPPGVPGAGEGSAAASIADIKSALGLQLKWFNAGETAAQVSPIVNAVAAIAAGYADHVLCWRAMGERWVPMYGQADLGPGKPPPATGWKSWLAPYFAPSAANWVALHASAHMHKYGITREQMSAIPIVQRRNAGLNPKAIYREPLTLEKYMNARMISTPFGLYDCDVPCDGTTAVIVSRREAAKDLRHKPVRIEAVGVGAVDVMDTWVSRNDFPHMMMHDAAKMLWSRTDLRPKDVDSAHIYDGFTYLVMFWLEALGFCPEGEAGNFVGDGTRISRDGELALNTNGGQLSEGRMHGFGHLHEAVLQLRGQAGERQVKEVEVSITAVGGGSLAGCVLLTRD
jgi:acetyl-CoA acetyltransferase